MHLSFSFNPMILQPYMEYGCDIHKHVKVSMNNGNFKLDAAESNKIVVL